MWSVDSHFKQYLTCLEYSDNSNRKSKTSTSTQRVSTVLKKIVVHVQVYNKSNATGATYGAGTAYPSGASWFKPSFIGVSVARY